MRCFRAILHDPKRYPDPEEFKPERFLNEDGSVREDPALSLAFGVGKRICPGRHLVDSTVFIVACSVLSVFNVTKSKDKKIPVHVGVSDPRRILEYVKISISPITVDAESYFQDIPTASSILFFLEIKLQRI